MRFASIVTIVAAVASAPLMASATSPQMGEGQFVSAVRCAAYDSLPQFAGENSHIAGVRSQLNGELRRQPATAAAAAHDAVEAIARQAANADAAALEADRTAACSGADQMIAGGSGEREEV
ncbi:MAG: hypothetical protein WDM79_12860 [Terricaulis sp.]